VTETATPTTDMERRLEAFRGVRETIEASILPLATSVDGRTFSFQASLHGLALRAGGYVVLEDAGGSRLGQLLSLELAVEEATAIEQPAASAEGATTRSRVLARLARGVGAILEGDGPTRAASSSISARLPPAGSSRSPRAQCCARSGARARARGASPS
jgi:hypothetical protein